MGQPDHLRLLDPSRDAPIPLSRLERELHQLLDIVREQSEQLRILTTLLLETARDRPSPSQVCPDTANCQLLRPSRRQREMMDLIGAGLCPGEIAARMHISLSTVYTHRVTLMEKLDLRNPSELTRFVLEHRGCL